MNLAEIFQALTLAGVIGIAGLILRAERRMTRVETVLTGMDGSNGINGTVKQLRTEHDTLHRQVEQNTTDIAVLQERMT